MTVVNFWKTHGFQSGYLKEYPLRLLLLEVGCSKTVMSLAGKGQTLPITYFPHRKDPHFVLGNICIMMLVKVELRAAA